MHAMKYIATANKYLIHAAQRVKRKEWDTLASNEAFNLASSEARKQGCFPEFMQGYMLLQYLE